MYWRTWSDDVVRLPGGQPMNRNVARCHPQCDGPAIVPNSSGVTVWPSRVQA